MSTDTNKITVKGRLLGNRVMIAQNPASKEVGGVVLSEESSIKKSSGIVVKIGNEVKEVAENDSVIYNKYSGTEIIKDGKKFVIVNEQDVILILEV